MVPLWPYSNIEVPSHLCKWLQGKTGCPGWPLPSGWAHKVVGQAAFRVGIPHGRGLKSPSGRFGTQLSGQWVHLLLGLAMAGHANGPAR